MRRLLAVLALGSIAACSSAKKTTPELSDPKLSEMEGKRIALTDVDGEGTARKVIEVALINQLALNGTFFLISKEEVQAARVKSDVDESDWIAVARAASADYAMRARVEAFDADTSEGYSKEIVEDSQMAAERGEKERMTERLYKVRRLKGSLKVRVEFASVADPKDLRTGYAEESGEVVAEAKTSAAHLPPKLRFMEKLANQAFAKFFEKYD